LPTARSSAFRRFGAAAAEAARYQEPRRQIEARCDVHLHCSFLFIKMTNPVA
jgi:hypothetical protein